MGLPCLYKMKRKIVLSTLRKEWLWRFHGTQPGSQKNCKTRVKLQAEPQKVWRANHCTKLISVCTRWTPECKNKGSLPSKRAVRTNPTMSIFGTKLALTSNPPTYRLTSRPQGIVSTGSQPLISWSIKKRIPYPPQMTLCFLKCTLTQKPVFTMSTESVKVCLLPSTLTYYERHLFDRAKRSGLHDHVQPPPISFASELVGLIARKDISASKHTNKKIKDSFARILPSHFTAAFQKWALITKE